MVTMNSTDEPKKLVLFDEVLEGYWTGDGDSSCFNSISPTNDSNDKETRRKWYNSCNYIQLMGLDPNKKYKVTLHVEAEEIS